MNRRAALLMASILVAVAVLVAWLMSGADGDPPAPGPQATPPTSAAGTRRATKPLRPYVPRGTGARPGEPATVNAPAAAATPNGTAETATPPPRVTLRVVLMGLERAVPPAASNVTVAVAQQGGNAAQARSLARSGLAGDVFELDVSALVPDGAGWTSLAVQVDRPGYLPCVGYGDLRPSKRSPAAPVRETVEVTLRSAGWVTGVVQDDRFRPVAFADVGAFTERMGKWTRVDAARTDAQGMFRLRLVPGEANLVAVAAEGMEPQSSQVTGVARAETTLAPFTLREGLAISGTVRFADGGAVPDARIVAQPNWAQTDLPLGLHRLAFRGGVLFDSPAGTQANTGLFRVSGLVPGDYDVSVQAPNTAADLLLELTQRATPPCEPIAFELAGGRIAVEVTSGGRPVPGVGVVVGNAKGGVRVTTDRRGTVSILAVPDRTYTVTTDLAGFEPERRAVVAPAAGQDLRVPIAIRGNRPKLRLVLAEEPTGAPPEIAAADVRLYFGDDPLSDSPDAADTVSFVGGRATTTAPWPGTYRIVVLPRSGAFLLPAETHAVLNAGTDTTVELTFPHGGRLTVAAHGADGKPVAARFRVLAADGTELLAGDANTSADWLLARGTYRLELTPRDGPAVETPLTIAPGRTMHADVELPGAR